MMGFFFSDLKQDTDLLNIVLRVLSLILSLHLKL